MTARPLVGAAILGALSLLVLWRLAAPAPDAPAQLVVYCAAGVRPALEEIAKRYGAGAGVRVALQFGPSGALEAQARLSERGDLFIPAAEDPYLKRMQSEGLVEEVTPLAVQRLGVAYAPQEDVAVASVEELLGSDIAYGLCNEQAAAGHCTKRVLASLGKWEAVLDGSAASFPTVTELAEAVRDSGRIRAGVLWDATAGEFGLRWTEAPELVEAVETISVGLLSCSRQRDEARRFVRFLASPEEGQRVFVDRHFGPLGTEESDADGLRTDPASTTIKP